MRACPEDLHINLRIRLRRHQLGLPLSYLADHLGVSKQQIDNYEAGRHRVSAGRLYQIAYALRTPMEWFCEGLPTIDASFAHPEDRKRWERVVRLTRSGQA